MSNQFLRFIYASDAENRDKNERLQCMAETLSGIAQKDILSKEEVSVIYKCLYDVLAPHSKKIEEID